MREIAIRVVTLTLAIAMAAFVLVRAKEVGQVELPGPFLDKIVHVGYYGVMAGLLDRGLVAPSPVAAFAIAVAVGVADELNQASVPGRHPSILDALADALGAALAIAIRRWHRNPRR